MRVLATSGDDSDDSAGNSDDIGSDDTGSDDTDSLSSEEAPDDPPIECPADMELTDETRFCASSDTPRNGIASFRLNDNQNGHDAVWNPDEYVDPIHDPNVNRVTMQ